MQMKIGGHYNWRNQQDRMVYIGCHWGCDGYWHQFEKVGRPGYIWCEVRDSELPLIEETTQPVSTKHLEN